MSPVATAVTAKAPPRACQGRRDASSQEFQRPAPIASTLGGRSSILRGHSAKGAQPSVVPLAAVTTTMAASSMATTSVAAACASGVADSPSEVEAVATSRAVRA